MRRKLVLALLLLAAVVGSASAVDFLNYAEGVRGAKLLNVGIGLGSSPYKVKIPPIQASFEVPLPIDLPITVGGYLGFTTYGESLGSALGKYTGTRVAIGARGAYHIDLDVPPLDLYAGLALGYLIWSQIYSYSGSNTSSNLSTFFWGGFVGTRYFFTERIGAYAEVGYSSIAFLNIGLAVKI